MISFKIIENLITKKNLPNYLTINATNLSQHLISKYNTEKQSVIILGSSGVAGSNVPFHTTIADNINLAQDKFFVYNLAKVESSCLEEFIFLKQALNIKIPKSVILGITPEMLFGNLASLTASFNIETVRNELTPEMVQSIQRESQKKMFPMIYKEYLNSTLNPTDLSIAIQSLLYNYKINFLGYTFAKNLTGHNGTGFERIKNHNMPFYFLNAIIEICQKNNIEIMIYLEPQIALKQINDTTEYKNFIKKMEANLATYGLSLLDYTHLLPETPEYFIDYIHLKPKGYQLVSKQILLDYQQKFNHKEQR